VGQFDCGRRFGLEYEKSGAHIPEMWASGWKFVGEFKRGRKESVELECIVAISNRIEAEEIARKRLVGADEITATELSRAELAVRNLREGDVRLS
jgi:hypothetical protein